MSSKSHFTVVRNQGYTAKEFRTRQRHNERQNVNYHNGDIIKKRSDLNHHYLKRFNPDGTPETYEDAFSRMVNSGEIVKRGLKPDAKVFAELVFDVNSTYFEQYGGYEYAQKFFDEVYRLAVKEVGDERYVLSAVLHSDERNIALSEQYGYDIYHYHLHVVYVPVVPKEVYYRKDMKDKTKAGKLKEIIPQISHSKKWPIKVQVERNGKSYFVNSYSLLQDRYYEHMIAAGFEGFERGERGSTAEHLDVIDYKIKKDNERLDELENEIEQTENELDDMEEAADKKEAYLKKLDEEIKVKEKARVTIREVDAIGKPALIGTGFTVTADEMKKLKTLAKKSVTADDRIRKAKNGFEKDRLQMSEKIDALTRKMNDMQTSINSLSREVTTWKHNYNALWNDVKDFIWAIRNIPQQLKSFIDRFRSERSLSVPEETQRAKRTDMSL